MQALLIKAHLSQRHARSSLVRDNGPTSLLDFTVGKMVELAGGSAKECEKEHTEGQDPVISPGGSAVQFCLRISTCYRFA